MKKFKTAPTITVEAALVPYEGNHTSLAKMLCISRSYVGKWKKRKNKDLPELYARRFADRHPDLVNWPDDSFQ